MIVTVLAGISSVGASGLLTAALTSCGLRHLRTPDHRGRPLPVVGAVFGTLVGTAPVSAAVRSEDWRLVPAFVLWGCVLVALGICDATTQRIPSAIVRPGALAVAVLFTVGFVVGRDWQGLALAATASLASAAVAIVCWRFLGAGLGDVRLALVGGVGLGGADGSGLVVGFLLFATVVVGQVLRQRATAANRTAHIPLGPALAAGFLSAAILSMLA